MGVLVKRPGDKVVFNPIKFWGGLGIFALFLSVTITFIGPSYSEAEIVNDPTGGGFTYIDEDDDSDNKGKLRNPDPSCPSVWQGELIDGKVESDDPEAGLVAICGRVMSAAMSNTYKDDEAIYRDTRNSLVGVTVAVYENDAASETGKNFEGELVHLFSSTGTNADGRFRIKTRGIGPGGGNVYVVALCNGQYVGGKRIKSMNQISDLDMVVNCNPNVTYAYVTPPPSLKIINRETVQECVSDVLEKAKSALKGELPIDLSVKYEKPTKVHASGLLTESNYDFRYVSTGDARDALSSSLATNLLFENSTGALWKEDCEIRNPDKKWLCSSEEMDKEYDNTDRGYLINTALYFIPEKSELLAWRRLDTRASFKQLNQNPFAMQQFMSTAFGSYTTTANFFENPPEKSPESFISSWFVDDGKGTTTVGGVEDGLEKCEDIEEGNSINRSDFEDESGGTRNTYLTSGYAMMLGSPGEIQAIANTGIAASELDEEYCVLEEADTILTVRDVIERPEYKRRFSRPEMYLPKGSGKQLMNTEVKGDSARQDNKVKQVPQKPFGEEADAFAHDQAEIVLTEGDSSCS